MLEGLTLLGVAQEHLTALTAIRLDKAQRSRFTVKDVAVGGAAPKLLAPVAAAPRGDRGDPEVEFTSNPVIVRPDARVDEDHWLGRGIRSWRSE
ncbi:hypothetical protein ACGFIY_33230 [Micromonospora chersina]|uniref:hypothetical protein n=1 Tax=Micromonospora chersina TaxID=47854 RepID=UPI003714EF4A